MGDIPACVANSIVVGQTRTANEAMESGGGIGQIFTQLGGKQQFSLLEVARQRETFSRVYTLSNEHIVCHIEEVMPRNLFEDTFFAADAGWHPDRLVGPFGR